MSDIREPWNSWAGAALFTNFVKGAAPAGKTATQRQLFLLAWFRACRLSRFLVSFLRVLVSLGGVFHRMFGKFVSGLVISLGVMHRSDAVSVRGKVMELGGSLVPVVAAFPAMASSITSIAHESLL